MHVFCVHVEARDMSPIFLSRSPLYFWVCLLVTQELTDSGWLRSFCLRLTSVLPPTHTQHLAPYMSAGNLNSDPYTCLTGSLSAEPSPPVHTLSSGCHCPRPYELLPIRQVINSWPPLLPPPRLALFVFSSFPVGTKRCPVTAPPWAPFTQACWLPNPV